MSFRNWVFIAALGLIVATSGQAYGQTEGGGNGTADQEQPSQILPRPFPVQIIEDDEAANARERREEEAREHEKEDLAAQQGMNIATQAMNEATQRMAWYSLGSTILVALGTALLLWTLLLTRQANQAAARSVHAAEDSIDVARETWLNQLRPWIVAVVPHPYITQDSTINGEVRKQAQMAIVEWRNTGQSPAINAHVRVKARTVEHGQEFEPFNWPEVQADSVVGPGMSFFTGEVFLSPDKLDLFLNGEVDFIVGSRADYTHSMDQSVRSFTEVVFRISVNGIVSDESSKKSHPRYEMKSVLSRIG